MTRYVDSTVDIPKIPCYAKINQNSDLANVILRDSVDFGYSRKQLTYGKTSFSNFIF